MSRKSDKKEWKITNFPKKAYEDLLFWSRENFIDQKAVDFARSSILRAYEAKRDELIKSKKIEG